MREFIPTGSDKILYEQAVLARNAAYTPYSKFAVGAALLTADGRIYTGCNIESASFTPTNCAERTAFFKAVSEGERRFAAIAIVGAPAGEPADYCPPCGVCRQVMREFVSPASFRVLLGYRDGRVREYSLEELLPQSFGPEDLPHE